MNKFDQSSRPWWIQHLDKGMLAGGMLYLLLVGAWILFQSRQTPETAIAETENVEIVTQADQEFMAYLQQSLETLRQPQVSPQAPPPATTEATVAIANVPPTSPAPPPLSSPPQIVPPAPMEAPPSTTVVERYYYPVYPNNAAAPPMVPQSAPPPTVQAPPSVPMVASATKHDLVGVLESGDRSSALFRWNDMTQKIQLGEAIGSSGWQLTSVVGQKAILSRQGKTRYLEVGQSF
ncbi:MAG: hypothetical protein VKL20_03180 [Synechocystis sp.]|nr:hypothetical protein [Synechocystis sp.]